MRQELVESVFVVIQTRHGDQEALNDLPGLSSVVRLRVGALQAVQRRLDCLRGGGQQANSLLRLSDTKR